MAKLYRIIASLLFISSILFGSENIAPGIQGIFITGKKEDILFDGRPNIKGIQISDIEIPGDEKAFKNLLESHLGKPLTKEEAIGIKQQILLYYVSKKKSLVTVEIPEQKTANNVIQVLIIKNTFGKPVYKGEIWYSSDQLNQYLGVEPGQEIAEDALQNNLSWLNKNPFHYTTANFVESDQPGVFDLEVSSKQRRPIRLYARGDNTGSESTGYGRFATGFSWGNAFWIGDLLSFEYMFSNEFKRYQSYTGNYTSFLPWKHVLTLFGNYATVEPTSLNASITAHSTQFYLDYTIPIKPLFTPFKQEVIFGVEYKNTNSNIVVLSTGEAQVQLPNSIPIVQELNVTQLYANYTLYDMIGNHNISFSLDLYGSPFSFLPHQSNADFNQLRPNSENKYFYTHLTFAEIYTVPEIMSICVLIRGQVSNNTLPPTELLCLGGYNTVRGYHECEYSADNGFIGNFELRTLPIRLSEKRKDQLIFLTFLDYAVGNNWFIPIRPRFRTPPNTQYLLGVGPGMRYAMNPNIQARIDYGFKLNQLFINSKAEEKLRLGFGQFHLGLLLSY